MFVTPHLKNIFIDFRERVGGWERERERGKHRFVVLPIYWLILECTLTIDRTCNLGVLRPCSNHLSYLSRAVASHFEKHLIFIYLFLKKIIYLFIFRQRGRERERERNISVWLPLTCPPLRTWPATQACALTGNRTGDPSVHRPALNPLSHTSQG